MRDANLWSGVYRCQLYTSVPTVVVTVRLREWGLPFALHVGGHLICKPGLTFVVGPIHISWSRL